MASDWYDEMEKAEQENDAREYELAQEYSRGYEQGKADKEKELSELPNQYSEKLWKNAYKKGRANAIDELSKEIHYCLHCGMGKDKSLEHLINLAEKLKEQK